MPTLAELPSYIADRKSLQQSLDFWLEARGDVILPSETDLPLSRFGDLVRNLNILEIRPTGDVNVLRTAPRQIELTGVDYTGWNFVDMAPPQERKLRLEHLWRMAYRPTIALSNALIKSVGDIYYKFLILCLPVIPSDDDGRRLLYTVSFFTGETLPSLYSQFSSENPVSRNDIYFDIGAGTDPVPFGQKFDFSRLEQS